MTFLDGISNAEVFREIEREMRAWIGDDSSGHDLDHAWRVFNVGVKISEQEDADIEVVGAAVLTHDIHRSMGEEGEYTPPEDSLSAVRSVLEATAFPDKKIPDVLHCVAVHEEYEFDGGENPAETTEALVLQDADNLDAIGAVGIARNFAFTGVVGNRLWAPDTDEYSGLGHFDDKLLHLKDEMNTEAARAVAEERHAFLVEFAERFTEEWYGEQ
ncbi:metal dependent phosphohydrolase [Haloferax elongans ATCC BAA-1513]|uniref:Metal dependent phosphohydrolase n=1 Tax=Haloferax elongans ATCC BAA-1513 TaxID=1230453 RepID=M0HN02_HALEO|nr:HD domain-containing protein [Haloferax elongans]ELZ85886.1 metal dependent phosphohydrolase [Haloferax elongans ATCC BAA-1513]